MEVLFHFIFELIKISILSCVYATLILVFFRIIGGYKPESWFASLSSKKIRLWLISLILVWAGLFWFMFSYFGNHGLGDGARVPVGHFQVVNQINGNDTYLQNSKGEQFGINSFTFDHKKLYAESSSGFNENEAEYIVWDLKSDSWTFYKTKQDYLREATKRHYPTPNNFEPFLNHYDRYWGGWRFWFLP